MSHVTRTHKISHACDARTRYFVAIGRTTQRRPWAGALWMSHGTLTIESRRTYESHLQLSRVTHTNQLRNALKLTLLVDVLGRTTKEETMGKRLVIESCYTYE